MVAKPDAMVAKFRKGQIKNKLIAEPVCNDHI
jgi:hypothetical protein